MGVIQQSQLMANQRSKYASPKMRNFLPMRRGPFKALKEIDKGNVNAKGWYYMFGTTAPRNFTQSPFASSEGGVFKDAGGNAYLVQNVLVLTHRASLNYTDQVSIVNNRADRQEIPSKVVDQMDKDHLMGLENAMSRQFWGNRTNEVARISAINTGTRTVTCNDANNLFGVYLLSPGDRLEAYSNGAVKRVSGGGTSQDYFIVETISRENKQFVYRGTDLDGNTITAPALVAATDILYPEGGKDNALTGVESILANSGQFQGLSDRTVSDVTTGTTLNAATASLSVAYLRRMTSEFRYADPNDSQTSQKSCAFYVSAQEDAFAALGDALQPTQQEGQSLTLGRSSGLSFNGIPFRWHAYVPRDVVTLLDVSKLEKGVLKDYGPVGGNEPIMKQINGQVYDAFIVPYSGYWNMGCETPRYAGVWLKGLATAGYAMGHGA